MSILAPLLRPASWRLAPGAADAPLIRLAGQALIVLSGLALLAWSLATWHGAWVRTQIDWPAALAVLCCLGWSWQASRLWRNWSAPSHRLTLRWTGPPSSGGGWRVDEWGEVGVEVALIWDWQHVLLVRLKPLQGGAPVWVWLSERLGNEVHRLRTLVCLPPSFTQADASVGAASGPVGARALRQVASSMGQPARSARSMSVSSLSSLVRSQSVRGPGRGVDQADSAGLAAPLRIEDDFPLTQFFDRDDLGFDPTPAPSTKGPA